LLGIRFISMSVRPRM